MAGDGDGAARGARVTKPPDERRAEIVAVTRTLFAERGIAKTSIKDVAERVGVARGLIYYYFADKDELVDAVLEDYIAEFVESIRRWDAEREVGNIEQALIDCIALFRGQLARTDPLSEDLRRIENSGLYTRFVDRAVSAIVDCFQVTTVEAYARRHRIAIEHVKETFYVLVYGLIGLARSNPAIDDAVLVGIVKQTLYLDRGTGGSQP